MNGVSQPMTAGNNKLTHIAGLDWSMLAVRSSQEWNVSRAIEIYPTYLPLEKRIVVIRGRKIKKERPLWPGYLPVQVTDKEWGEIEMEDGRGSGLRGSMGLLKDHAGNPLKVPAAFMSAIIHAENVGCFDYTIKSSFRENASVEVLHGPFAGFIAMVRSAAPRKRAKILLNFLGGKREFEIDTLSLREVGT